MTKGKFVISLDFELMWGMRDIEDIASYGKSILAVHDIIPKLLNIFTKYGISATFSTVGFLFFEKKEDLIANIPSVIPDYEDQNLSPYLGYFDVVGENYLQDRYHFAQDLIREIQKYPQHEIGTHTFSHYYCLEPGQTTEAFNEDLKSAASIAKKYNINLTSLVFPRNQFNEEYLKLCTENGILCYRGNERSWIYKAKSRENENLFRRGVRFLDAYFNISGHNCYSDRELKGKLPLDIPSSRFLRPFSENIQFLEGLRLKRIKTGMTHAAKNNLTYHLWWHPHNFGLNQEENFKFLEEILMHYQYLNSKYDFESYTMTALAKLILNGK
ncbi:polysaccharide deacetylase family protein [Chryseobacterium foetidum]|uniref:polysaccharide deacetylase family protein n=1 Tax=Chryseobacterium foetidum TaxID=2951057 RepID=UPI0021C9A89C|nr:polysaccharide deacetylase family protein [Chryseobacterium foetidum]